MTIIRKKNGTSSYKVIMTECPWCGHWFGEDVNGGERSGHFETAHGPEVFDDDHECDQVTKLEDFK